MSKKIAVMPFSEFENMLAEWFKPPANTMGKSKRKSAEKFDDDKPRYDLLPAHALDELAQVYTFGAKKYAPHNWRLGFRWGRVFAAIMRHLWAFWRGENIDPESNCHHLAHAAWGRFTLIEFYYSDNGEDDRPQ